MSTEGRGTTERLNCLVTGASGYIGGRLVPELLEAGHTVRCLARSPKSCATTPGRERSNRSPGMSPTPRPSLRACAGSTWPTTWCTPSERVPVSRTPIAVRHKSSPNRPGPRECGGSCTSADSRRRASRSVSSHRTCAPVRRWAASSWRHPFRPPCCGLPWSSARDRRPSRCCATSRNVCRSWSLRAG